MGHRVLSLKGGSWGEEYCSLTDVAVELFRAEEFFVLEDEGIGGLCS